MKPRAKVLNGLLVAGGVLLSTQVWAGCPSPIALPAPSAATSVQFGDAIVYSLPLLVEQGVIPTGVDSSPGKINDCIVIGSGAGGNVNNNSLPGLADNAYDNLQGSQNPYFRTGSSANNLDPGGGGQFTGDTDRTWDIKLSALLTYLNGGSLTVLFNHNQTGSGTGGIDEDLFIWAQVALRNTTTGAASYFYASASPNNTGLSNFGQPGGDPTTFSGPQNVIGNLYPDQLEGAGMHGGACTGNGGLDGLPACDASYMIRARGRVCLTAGDVPVPCGDPTATHFINDNLGANEVANAVVFPELNALMAGIAPADVGNYVLQVDWRMGCNAAMLAPGTVCPAGSVLNNGYEQLFIIGGPANNNNPEPGSLGLAGAALVGLAALRRRRGKA